jgi:hypothetical protein
VPRKAPERINRFNNKHNFIHQYQKIMIERLLLNRNNEYHPDNIKHILHTIGSKDYVRNENSISTRITGGLILTTKVEADFYVLLQEKIKDLTGEYASMDEFLHLLLTWFYQYYSKPVEKRISAPLVRKKTKPTSRIHLSFKNHFSPYYKNILLT